jgi:hypothetical protein
MNEKQPWQLADDLETKLSDFKKINDVLADAQLRLGSREPDTFALYAAAAILHDLYNGIENICR